MRHPERELDRWDSLWMSCIISVGVGDETEHLGYRGETFLLGSERLVRSRQLAPCAEGLRSFTDVFFEHLDRSGKTSRLVLCLTNRLKVVDRSGLLFDPASALDNRRAKISVLLACDEVEVVEGAEFIRKPARPREGCERLTSESSERSNLAAAEGCDRLAVKCNRAMRFRKPLGR